MKSFKQLLLEVIEVMQSEIFDNVEFPISIKPQNVVKARRELFTVADTSHANSPTDNWRGLYDLNKRDFYFWYAADGLHVDVGRMLKTPVTVKFDVNVNKRTVRVKGSIPRLPGRTYEQVLADFEEDLKQFFMDRFQIRGNYK